MPSRALDRWSGERSAALERLERVHAGMTGGLVGRPRDARELTHALFLRLAAELQGFCRDLHDESVDVLAAHVSSPAVRAAFRTTLTAGRKLGSGNAGPANLGNDWSRLGMSLWPALRLAYPGAQGAASWHSRLGWLNTARNGVAHSDAVAITAANVERPLTIATFRATRRKLDRLATGMDAVTGAYLSTATGGNPW